MGLQETIKALSDPTRRAILEMLKENELSAGDISSCFNISAAAVSRHLAVLKEADLVRDRREGKFVIYEVNLSVMQEMLTWISNFITEPKENESVTRALKDI